MSDKPNVKSIDIINIIQREVMATLDQVGKLDLNESNVNANGNIIGPAAIMLTKVNMLSSLLDTTRGTAVFEGIDRKVVAMARAGNDLRNAFGEMVLASQETKKDAAAKEYLEGIVKAWDEAIIG